MWCHLLGIGFLINKTNMVDYDCHVCENEDLHQPRWIEAGVPADCQEYRGAREIPSEGPVYLGPPQRSERWRSGYARSGPGQVQ